MTRESPQVEKLMFGEALSSYLEGLEALGVPAEDIEKFYLGQVVVFLNSSSTQKVKHTERLHSIGSELRLNQNGNGSHNHKEGTDLIPGTKYLI